MLETIMVYLIVGIVIALFNIENSGKLFKNSTYEQYKTKKMAKSIRKIIIFNNVKTISNRIIISLSYIIFYPLMLIIKLVNPYNYENKMYYIPTIFITKKIFKILGEKPAYKNKIRIDKNYNEYQTIYTLNGKMKFYRNGKLHNSEKVWAVKEDCYIAPAIRNVPFYYKNGEITKFNFGHEEQYFIEGKEVDKFLHSQYLNKLFKEKINNF